MTVTVAGLRVAGYSDPFKRRRAQGYRATREPEITDSQKTAFWELAAPLVGRVDVVMVHAPALAETALAALRFGPARSAAPAPHRATPTSRS